MARKQSVPRISESFLGKKFKESTGMIAGRGRRTLFTEMNFGAGVVSAGTTFYTKTFSSRVMKSAGDSIEFRVMGHLNLPLFGNALIRVWVGDENTTELLKVLETPLFGDSPQNFEGFGTIVLRDTNVISSQGVLLSDDATTPIKFTTNSSVTFTGKKLIITLEAEGGGAAITLNDLVVDFLKGEFCPAVIT